MKIKFFIAVFFLANIAFAGRLEEKITKKKSNSKAPAEIIKIMQKATKDLEASGIEKTALSEGTKVPSFKLDGKKIEDIYGNGVTVISFYRGGWCPYCMLQLKEYQRIYSEFKKANINLIAIAPDTRKEIAKTKRNHKLTFPIYKDENNHIAEKFGLAFQLPSNLLKVYKKFNIDLEASQGNDENRLPLPGTYIIDTKGNIRYAFAKADYTLRAEPEDVLKRAKAL